MKNSLKTQIESHIEFRTWYHKIVKDFNFDLQKDREARDLLSRILEKKTPRITLRRFCFLLKIISREKNISVFMAVVLH